MWTLLVTYSSFWSHCVYYFIYLLLRSFLIVDCDVCSISESKMNFSKGTIIYQQVYLTSSIITTSISYHKRCIHLQGVKLIVHLINHFSVSVQYFGICLYLIFSAVGYSYENNKMFQKCYVTYESKVNVHFFK